MIMQTTTLHNTAKENNYKLVGTMTVIRDGTNTARNSSKNEIKLEKGTNNDNDTKSSNNDNGNTSDDKTNHITTVVILA